MTKIKKIFVLFALFLFFLSCGYTPIFSKKDINFNIENIEFSGNRDVNNKIDSTLSIYKNKSDFIKDSFTWNIRKKHGYKLIEVYKNELQELVPGLSNEYSFAIKIENQGYISNSKKYLTDLIEGFKNLGGTIIEEEVKDILSFENKIKIETKENKFICDDVVITAGVFSEKLSKKYGANVPMQSERGYHLELIDT